MKNSVYILIGSLLAVPIVIAAAKTDGEDDYAPHTPTLTFHVAGLTPAAEAPIVAAAQKLKSVSSVKIDSTHGLVQVRFDSHVVSYHQVAQAIRDAGTALGKQFDPTLKFIVADYAKGENARKVDAIFAGKRLNMRVKIEPADKAKGEFLVHFLPLKVDPADQSPQGFNGGHLHHPISDPVPRGLALPSSYPTEPKIP
jgi:copper chaperone CopZ